MAATTFAAAPYTVPPASLAAERAVLEAGQLARRTGRRQRQPKRRN